MSITTNRDLGQAPGGTAGGKAAGTATSGTAASGTAASGTSASGTSTGGTAASGTSASGGTAGSGTSARIRRLQLAPHHAFGLQVSMLVFLLAASSAPTPLYSVYQAEWGFSPVTVTVVFGVYALAVLSALLTVGSLSDHIGRRPVLLVALALQAAAMLVFATADGVTALVLARIIQGLSAGAAVGALSAGLIDLHKTRGTIASSVGAIGGTATGALGSGLVVQYLPAPTRLVYLVLFAIFALQAVGVAVMPESSALKPGALQSLKPQLGLPAAARRPLLLAVPVVVAVWALAGFYGSLGPSLLRLLAGSHSVVLGGLGLFALAGSAAAIVFLSRGIPTRAVMMMGTAALLLGVSISLVAITRTSVALFFVGTIVAGIGFGGGFQGALRTVVPLAEAHERAGVLSTIYVVAYLALGLPAVIAGVVVTHDGVLTTARGYAIAIMILAATSLVGLALQRPARKTAAQMSMPSLAIGASSSCSS
jgi:MFS family permease